MPSSINASTTAGVVTTADTSGVLNIQTAGTTAISIDASQAVTFTNSANLPNTFGFKNRIINGAMVIAQRGTSFTAGAASLDYTLDRWAIFEDTDGVCTVAQDTSVYPVGFTNSLKFTTTTADSSLAAGQRVFVTQRIEGFNTADLAWGTANAATVTLSFWVRSTLTGTFGGALENGSFNRSYPFTYTISAANTWEQKSVTIAGDTSGTWSIGNTLGIQVAFGLGVGTDNSGTAGAWAASNLQSATGAVSVIGTLNATWQVSGVQLEKGATATSFDYRPYGTELALCQRYFMQFGKTSSYEHFGIGVAQTNYSTTIMNLPVTMRAAPTFSYTGSLSGFVVFDGVSILNPSSIIADVMSLNVCSLAMAATGIIAGNATRFYRDATSTVSLNYSAEL